MLPDSQIGRSSRASDGPRVMNAVTFSRRFFDVSFGSECLSLSICGSLITNSIPAECNTVR